MSRNVTNQNSEVLQESEMELGNISSASAWERLRGPSARYDPESKCSGSTLRSLQVQVLGDDSEIKCSGIILSLGTRVTSPRGSELAPKDKK